MTSLDDLFPGFASHWVDTPAGRIFARAHGSGPPLVLLHGFPQSLAMWRLVAPALAERFSVVALDLRGYGWSSAPTSAGGALYAKRRMYDDVIAAMQSLGHVRFHVVGHDRGARVAYRLALDHPGRIDKLALLDILPTCEVWKNIRAGVTPAAHWDFLSRPAPEPEREISKNPNGYFEGLMTQWCKSQSLRSFDARAMRAYRDAWGDPSRIHAFCEDYRAGATLDLEADESDLAAKKTIASPTLILSSDFYLTHTADKSAAQIWRETFAPNAQGVAIDLGHFLAEENPDAVIAALQAFLQ